MDDQTPTITVEQILDVHTMSDQEYMEAWAKHNKISTEAVAKLFQEGFISMEALKLIDRDDLAKAKLPRGQEKLVLASVQKLLETETGVSRSSWRCLGPIRNLRRLTHCAGDLRATQCRPIHPVIGYRQNECTRHACARQATRINIRMSKYGNIR